MNGLFDQLSMLYNFQSQKDFAIGPINTVSDTYRENCVLLNPVQE